jgi:biotin-(acetyl-CoA carboxylase) ligase
LLPNERISGTACGIDDGGALLVNTRDGRRRFLSGDVSLRVAS